MTNMAGYMTGPGTSSQQAQHIIKTDVWAGQKPNQMTLQALLSHCEILKLNVRHETLKTQQCCLPSTHHATANHHIMQGLLWHMTTISQLRPCRLWAGLTTSIGSNAKCNHHQYHCHRSPV